MDKNNIQKRKGILMVLVKTNHTILNSKTRQSDQKRTLSHQNKTSF